MEDILKQCRDINELSPIAQVLLKLALEEIKKNEIEALVIETYRSQNRQNYLYSKGRTDNVGSPKVTWTKNSLHTLRNAVDLVPVRNNKAIWNSRDKDTLEIVNVMCKYGFEAGANWNKNADSPHFQLKGISEKSKDFSVKNNNYYVTKMIQKKLNEKVKANLTVDGIWGEDTTKAINKFRRKRWKLVNGKLGVVALKELLS